MPDKESLIAESKLAEASHAAAVAEETRQASHAAQLSVMQEEGDKRMAKIQWETLERYFNRGLDSKKFVDISRIPFICDDIKNIHVTMDSMNETLTLLRNIIFSFIAIIVTGFMVAVFATVFKK